MRVLVVESAGFCWGVAEAIDKAMDIAKRSNGPVFSYGPLVHNKQVMSELESQRVHGIDASDDGIGSANGGTIVVRAHGVRPEVIQGLEKRAKETGAKFADLTCPLVKMVHNVIAGNAGRGYVNVIVGDAGHAEVIGLVGYGKPGETYVVANPAEAEKLPALDKVCVVSQTTQDLLNYSQTAEVVRRKSKVYRTVNTICRPTAERQSETEELAHRVKKMVVVGGRHSANTVRLVDLLKSWNCIPIHVETEIELNAADFDGLEEVGVTAGASTPTWMIDRVVERLESLGPRRRRTAGDLLRGAASLLIHTNLYAAAGAAGLAATACTLQGIPLDPLLLLIPALFVLSMHTLNRWIDRTRLDFADRVATVLYKKRPIPLLIVGAAAGIASVALAALLGWPPFALALFGLACGCIYGLRVLPEALTWRLGIRRLKDIPASRDLSTAAGWAVMAAVLPFLTLKSAPGPVNALTFAVAFLLVFLRTTALGIRDVSGDKIVGRETVFKALGAKRTRILAALMITALAGSLLTLGLAFEVRPALYLLGLVPWVAFYTWLLSRWTPRGFTGELLADGQNLIAGATILAASL